MMVGHGRKLLANGFCVLPRKCRLGSEADGYVEFAGGKGRARCEGLRKKSLLLLCLSVWAGSAPAQEPFQELTSVTAVSTVVRWEEDFWGGAPRLEQLEVFFDGRSVVVLGAEPILPQVPKVAPGSSRQEVSSVPPTTTSMAHDRRGVLVLLVRDLCSPQNRDSAVGKLRAYAEELARMGPVLLAVSPSSNEGPKLCETGEHLRKELNDLRSISVANWQVKLRSEAQSLQSVGLDAQAASLASAAEEIVRVRGALTSLRTSLLQHGVGKRVAFLIWDGFDFDLQGRQGPVGEFARSGERDQKKTKDIASLGLLHANYLPEVQAVAAAMASLGVPVVSLNPGYMAAYSPVWSAQFRRPAVSAEVFGRGSVAADELLVVAAHEPMAYLAEETGGTVIAPRESLAEGLKRLENTYLLWFQVPMAPDGKTHDLEVRVKDPGVNVWAPKRITLGNPGGQAEALAREVVARGYLSGGELAPEVDVRVEKAEGKSRVGRLEVRTDLGAVESLIDRLSRARLRVTVAVHMRKGEPFVHQEEFEQAVSERSAGTVWTYEAPIRLPKEAERLAVVVEELQTGAWGAAVVDVGLEKRR